MKLPDLSPAGCPTVPCCGTSVGHPQTLTPWASQDGCPTVPSLRDGDMGQGLCPAVPEQVGQVGQMGMRCLEPSGARNRLSPHAHLFFSAEKFK